MTAVVVRDVSVDLGGRRVLHDISLDVQPGDWVGLIGPNGAGKSTLLRAIAGARDFSGTIALDGARPTDLSPRELARRVAVVPQLPAVPLGLTVTDYVLLGRTPYIPYLGVESRRDLDVVADIIERLDLADLHHRDLTALSGGEFQRAVLARALAQRAPVLLLDEPTSALDIGHAHQVLELIDALRHEQALTVVTAMHDLTTAAAFADRLLLLADGRAVASGPVSHVLTEERLSSHYAANVRVVTLEDGSVAVVPVRARAVAASTLPMRR